MIKVEGIKIYIEMKTVVHNQYRFFGIQSICEFFRTETTSKKEISEIKNDIDEIKSLLRNLLMNSENINI